MYVAKGVKLEIIPHPKLLKDRERDLIRSHAKLSEKMCEMYLLEMELKEKLKKSKKRERQAFAKSLFFLIAGFLLGAFSGLL